MTTTNGKLAVRLIRLTNIGGVEGTLEVPLADITYLEGTNGVGKSSVVDGLAALCGGPVADLLNQRSEEGEVFLELTDDTWFKRRITRAGGNALTAGHPEQGSIGKAAAWLKATLSAAALSPAEFLGADDAKAAEYILRTAPLTVTREELAEAVGKGLQLPAIDVSGHALRVLDQAAKVLYDQRTGENRTANDAKTTAEQLRRSIPEDAPDPEELGEREASLQVELQTALEECDAAEKAAAHQAREAADAELGEIARKVTGLAQEVRRLEADLEKARQLLLAEQDRRDVVTRERDAKAEAAERAAGAQYTARLATISADLTATQNARETAIRAQAAIGNTREMIARQEATAKAAHARSQALTKAMARLDALKAAKAAELPVPGVSIEGGKLLIGGVPAHRANTAERVRVAIDASTVQPARVRFVFADDLEHLATKTRHEVEAACRERGIQILGARVTDDEQLVVRGADGADVPDPAQVGLTL